MRVPAFATVRSVPYREPLSHKALAREIQAKWHQIGQKNVRAWVVRRQDHLSDGTPILVDEIKSNLINGCPPRDSIKKTVPWQST